MRAAEGWGEHKGRRYAPNQKGIRVPHSPAWAKSPQLGAFRSLGPSVPRLRSGSEPNPEPEPKPGPVRHGGRSPDRGRRAPPRARAGQARARAAPRTARARARRARDRGPLAAFWVWDSDLRSAAPVVVVDVYRIYTHTSHNPSLIAPP